MTTTGLRSRPTRSPAAIPRALPLIGHAGALLRDPLGFLERAYPLGDVVALRLGPKPAYLVNGPEPMRQVLVADAASYDKGFQFDQLRILIGDGVGTSSGEKHRRQRRLMRPAFDHRYVEGYVASVARSTARTVDGWGAGARIEPLHEMRTLAMAATARVMFDAPDDSAADSPAVREIMTSLPVLLGGVGRRALIPLAVLNKAPTPGNRRFDRACAALHAMADRMVADHRARRAAEPGRAPAGPASFLSILLAAVDEEDGGGMSDQQAHDEIMTVLLAGTETSAGAASWTLHVLARDLDLQRAVQQEVDAVLGGRAPAAADLGRLPLTRRVVSEVLRRYPPGWLIGRRPVRDGEIAGFPVAAGTQVLLNFYGLHHDPAAFPDPARFDPDRWLDPDPAVLRSHYLPFGLGPRACVGEGFAWALVLTTVATIVARYTVTPARGAAVKPVARATLHPSEVHLTVRPR